MKLLDYSHIDEKEALQRYNTARIALDNLTNTSTTMTVTKYKDTVKSLKQIKASLLARLNELCGI